MRTKILIAIATLVTLACAAYAEQPKTSSQASSLRDKNAAVRIKAYKRIVADRSALIADLIAIVERKGIGQASGGPLDLAVQLLGNLRASEAVRALAKRLTYVPTGFPVTELLPAEYYYVCAEALIKIGQPSISAMTDIIRQSSVEHEPNMATWVIMQIEGT